MDDFFWYFTAPDIQTPWTSSSMQDALTRNPIDHLAPNASHLSVQVPTEIANMTSVSFLSSCPVNTSLSHNQPTIPQLHWLSARQALTLANFVILFDWTEKPWRHEGNRAIDNIFLPAIGGIGNIAKIVTTFIYLPLFGIPTIGPLVNTTNISSLAFISPHSTFPSTTRIFWTSLFKPVVVVAMEIF